MKSFPVELKTLIAGKSIKNASKIATYSPFIGPAGIIHSTGRILRLVNTKFDSKHPILLDTRHTLVRLLARSLHQKHFHQGLDYMRSALNMEYAILGSRRLLRFIDSAILCPIYLSNVLNISNYPSIIRLWITLERFTFRFAESLKKDWDFFCLPHHQGCTP